MAEAGLVEASPAFSSSSSSSGSPHTLELPCAVVAWPDGTAWHGMARQGCRELGWRLSPAPIPVVFGLLGPALGCRVGPGTLTSTCPQPEEDEELPVGCGEPAGAEQPGWERAPAAAPALEEPCRLVLSTPSSILRDEEIQELGPHLPPRATQQPWRLLYCTGRDGFSLRSLYRRGGPPGSPALLLIRDTEAQAFGAFCATAIRCSNGFYGTGETFLFSFSPELKVFRWTGRNNFFMKGDVDLLMVGGGSGRFGLWLDGDLHHGGSHPCETFDNETLSPREEFCVQDLEVWGLA
ncbi:TLD domain-containing protein 2 isoform X1 [Chroicocephalus ridibundus]|uniref:TLD domain-containing protein 2 isoform X1 n=1 Tax=Chroicocephalus ridibundus TaxID=1192867 RepID=UPI002FDD7B37